VNEPADYLLRELAAVRVENRALRRRVRELERSRAYWRQVARIAGWADRHNAPELSPQSPGFSTS